MPTWVTNLFPANSFDQGLAVWLIVIGVAFAMVASAAIFGVIVKVAFFLGPKITDFFANNAALTEHLRENGVTVSACLGRLCEMSDHTVKGIDQLHHKTDELRHSVDGMKIEVAEVKVKVREHAAILGELGT